MEILQHSSSKPRIGLAACVIGLPEIVTVARGAGYEFLVVDMEHGRIAIGDLAAICVTGLQSNYSVLARVTGPFSPDLARVLDCGATGVIVPHVDTVEQAQAIVAACRFAPLGARAIPGPLALLSFNPVSPTEVVVTSESSVEIHAMIESRLSLDSVSAIASVSGLTGLIIGANDLAADLGHIGNLAHPDVHSAFVAIAAAASDKGLGFGVMGLPLALLHSHGVGLGANMIVASNEINFLVDGARETYQRVKEICSN